VRGQCNTRGSLSKLKRTPPQRKINVTSNSPVGEISVVTLIRTDTTLDHSQKAEKVWSVDACGAVCHAQLKKRGQLCYGAGPCRQVTERAPPPPKRSRRGWCANFCTRSRTRLVPSPSTRATRPAKNHNKTQNTIQSPKDVPGGGRVPNKCCSLHTVAKVCTSTKTKLF
jgi:hypothetical protein